MGEGNIAVMFVNVNGQVLEISRNYFTVTHDRIDCGLRAKPAKRHDERLPSAAEEVVDMRGGWADQTYFYSLVR